MKHVVTDRYPYYNYWIATGPDGVALTAIGVGDIARVPAMIHVSLSLATVDRANGLLESTHASIRPLVAAELALLDGEFWLDPDDDERMANSWGSEYSVRHVVTTSTGAQNAERRGAQPCHEGMSVSRTSRFWRFLLNRGPQPINTIGQRINHTSGAVTTAVDRLETRGLVVRRFDPNDRRARFVTLTPQGTKTVGAPFGQHKKWIGSLTVSPRANERRSCGLIKKLGLAADEGLQERRHE